MTRFANVLKQAGDRLEVPESARTRILLEMAADLEDSYQHYLDQGLDDDEATRRAEEAFATSDETLRLLGRIHQGGLGSAGERFSRQIGSLWSKVLFLALLLFELLAALRVLSDRSFFVHRSPFLWPIAALALGVFAFTIWKLLQIFSRSGEDVRRLRIGLGIPLFVVGASLGVSVLGFLFHLQTFLRANADGAPEALFTNFAGWMIAISSLMTVGLLTAILAGLVWFVLSHLVSRSEAREIDSLLQAAT